MSYSICLICSSIRPSCCLIASSACCLASAKSSAATTFAFAKSWSACFRSTSAAVVLTLIVCNLSATFAMCCCLILILQLILSCLCCLIATLCFRQLHISIRKQTRNLLIIQFFVAIARICEMSSLICSISA